MNMDRGPWMRTFTGREFHFLDPKPEDIVLDELVHALAHENRFGGHTAKPYSVGQHCVLVSRRAEELAGARGEDAAGQHLAAVWGLLHDAAEAYCKDIPKPLKALLAPLYEPIEERILGAVAGRFGISLPFPQTVKRADVDIYLLERLHLHPEGNNATGLGGALRGTAPNWRFRVWEPEETRVAYRERASNLGLT